MCWFVYRIGGHLCICRFFNSIMGLTVGGKLFNVVQMAYSYEFSGSGRLGRASGTHEIFLGFLIGESKSDAPASTIKKPYYDWIK